MSPTAPPSPAPTPGEPSRRSKWLLVGGFWLVQWLVIHVGIVALLEPAQAFDLDILLDAENLVTTLIWAGIIAAAQAVFLWPVRRPTFRLQSGASLWLSIGTVALAAGLLVGGIVAACVDAAWLVFDVEPGGGAVGLLLGSLAIAWLIATPLLVEFVRRERRETALSRIAAGLFLGTIVESVAVIPLDVMVRRKTNCYCGQGTFFALVACGSVGLFALGPAIFLLILARRRKRWYAGHCDACGYDMSGTPTADRCPECGAGWRAQCES